MTGVYDLVAVLTHKGRSADSGHYVGWVKQENGWFLETELCLSGICLSVIINHYIYILLLTGKWIEFDDDNPKPRLQDDITRLSGGGENLLN
jgi:ubiquitin carboxyl-terminal hydrolase 14